MNLLWILPLSTLVALAGSAATAKESSLARPLSLLREGRIESARDELEQLDAADPSDPDALLLLGQIHFKAEDWHRFFAVTTVYRARYLEKLEPSTFRPKLLALEVVALAKLCRWDQAVTLLRAAQKREQELKFPPGRDLEDASNYLSLSHEFPKDFESSKKPVLPSALFSSSLFWKVSPRILNQPKILRKLRAHMDSACGKEG